MKNRGALGLILIFIGLIILLIGSFFGNGVLFVLMFYGLPLIIIGFVIVFNKKEDEIEQINYSKIKEGKRNGKK